MSWSQYEVRIYPGTAEWPRNEGSLLLAVVKARTEDEAETKGCRIARHRGLRGLIEVAPSASWKGEGEVMDESCEDDTRCGRPCDPRTPCDECDVYWQRMTDEGLWDAERHQWTEKGWRLL